MELLPGARVGNNCQNGGTSEIRLLGLEQTFTPFLVWKLGVARRFTWPGGAATVTAGVRNVGDSRQRDLGTGVDREPYCLSGPRTPRTLQAGLRWGF